MNYGKYKSGVDVWINVACHKFETGQEEDSVLTGYYIKTGDDFNNKVAITFNKYEGQKGIYLGIIDSSELSDGVYLIVIHATIDTVLANDIGYFEISGPAGKYGSGKYGVDSYASN